MTKDELEVYAAKAKVLIKENPLLAVLAAAALGFVLAKVSQRKIIYLEKPKS